jgi:hypothetical protein
MYRGATNVSEICQKIIITIATWAAPRANEEEQTKQLPWF